MDRKNKLRTHSRGNKNSTTSSYMSESECKICANKVELIEQQPYLEVKLCEVYEIVIYLRESFYTSIFLLFFLFTIILILSEILHILNFII